MRHSVHLIGTDHMNEVMLINMQYASFYFCYSKVVIFLIADILSKQHRALYSFFFVFECNFIPQTYFIVNSCVLF